MSSNSAPEKLDQNTPSANDSSQVNTAKSNDSPSSILDALPPWILTNLRSPRTWKTILRCWIASWASFVILLPDRSLRALGNTAFFALLASFFLPPYLPIQTFVILISMLMLGLLSGWAIGVAAMAAANAARSQSLLQSVTQQVQKSIAENPVASANPTLAFTQSIFSGDFLDIRSSAVYGCFLGFGAIVFGSIRAYAPKLLFTSIFGTIAIDIFCTIGPLLPTTEYNLLKSVAITVACYMAIGILVTIFVFPQTMNHLCMTMISAQLERLKALLEVQQEVLDMAPTELVPDNTLFKSIMTQRSALIEKQKALMSISGPINLEFSMGKWNGDDVRSMEEPLLDLVTRVSGLQNFCRLVKGVCHPLVEESPESSTSTLSTTTSTTPDHYVLHQLHHRNAAAEQANNVTITDLFPILKDSTRELRLACIAGLAAAKSTIDFVNNRRWKRLSALDAENADALRQAYQQLREASMSFKTIHRKRLVTPYLPLLLAAQGKKGAGALPLRALFISFVFAANLIVVADSIIELLENVQGKIEKRVSNRIWAPKGLRALGKLFISRDHDAVGGFGEDLQPEEENEGSSDTTSGVGQDEKSCRRDPDSRPPTNVVQTIMDRIHRSWKWVRTAEGWFVFKYVLLTVALWLPAVFKSSAKFYYENKGIWALIMAQTTLNIYAADQIFNLFARLAGTLVGLLFGLLSWFMGNGKGEGNPYGSAASVGVLLIPGVFLRIYAPQQYLPGVILGCVTFALIMGYSWVDGHYAQVDSPGIGWPVAWKRWVLVVIGAAASFIVMMLPPTSGRKAVRLRNASSITTISNAYGFLVSAWIAAKPSSSHEVPDARWATDFRGRLIAIGQEVGTIRGLTSMARWEGSIRGAWPFDEYMALVEVQSDMIASLAQLAGTLSHLGDNWRLTFLHGTKVLNPYFISDIMAVFLLVSQSLRTAEPMHQVLPTSLLDRLFYHHHNKFISTPSEHGTKHHPDVEEVQSLDYMYYAQGLVAVFQLIKSLDELHRITKRLCGEVPLAGFAVWKGEYQRKHLYSERDAEGESDRYGKAE